MSASSLGKRVSADDSNVGSDLSLRVTKTEPDDDVHSRSVRHCTTADKAEDLSADVSTKEQTVGGLNDFPGADPAYLSSRILQHTLNAPRYTTADGIQMSAGLPAASSMDAMQHKEQATMLVMHPGLPGISVTYPQMKGAIFQGHVMPQDGRHNGMYSPIMKIKKKVASEKKPKYCNTPNCHNQRHYKYKYCRKHYALEQEKFCKHYMCTNEFTPTEGPSDAQLVIMDDLDPEKREQILKYQRRKEKYLCMKHKGIMRCYMEHCFSIPKRKYGDMRLCALHHSIALEQCSADECNKQKVKNSRFCQKHKYMENYVAIPTTMHHPDQPMAISAPVDPRDMSHLYPPLVAISQADLQAQHASLPIRRAAPEELQGTITLHPTEDSAGSSPPVSSSLSESLEDRKRPVAVQPQPSAHTVQSAPKFVLHNLSAIPPADAARPQQPPQQQPAQQQPQQQVIYYDVPHHMPYSIPAQMSQQIPSQVAPQMQGQMQTPLQYQQYPQAIPYYMTPNGPVPAGGTYPIYMDRPGSAHIMNSVPTGFIIPQQPYPGPAYQMHPYVNYAAPHENPYPAGTMPISAPKQNAGKPNAPYRQLSYRQSPYMSSFVLPPVNGSNGSNSSSSAKDSKTTASSSGTGDSTTTATTSTASTVSTIASTGTNASPSASEKLTTTS